MLLLQQNMHEFHDALYLEVRWDIARKAFLYAILSYALLCLPLFISQGRQDSAVTTIVVRSESVPVLFTGSRKIGSGKSGVKKSDAKRFSEQRLSVKKLPEKKETKKITTPKKIQSKKIKTKKPEIKPDQKVGPKVALKKIEPVKQKIVPAPTNKPTIEPLKKSELIKTEVAPSDFAKASTDREPEKKIEEKKDEQEIEEVFVGASDQTLGEQEYDAQEKSHIALSRAIGRVWKAPRVKIKQPAHAIIEIDTHGKPVNVELEQKSGALIHDIESRAAALRAEYPQEFWGKKIRIIFGD